MTASSASRWEKKRNAETRQVEDVLHQAGFENAAAYRYNCASIRVRVIDSRFEGLNRDQRDALVEPVLAKLPDEIQSDIVILFTFAPSELESNEVHLRERFQNLEFEDPSPSML